jgi:hypothetical protein
MRKLCFLSGVIFAATLVIPLQGALAKGGAPNPAPTPTANGGGGGGGGNGGGGGGGGKTVQPTVTSAPLTFTLGGVTTVIPAGTAFGSVVGFAPAVPGFPAAPIILSPTFQHGE